jgi:hypothetical protein
VAMLGRQVGCKLPCLSHLERGHALRLGPGLLVWACSAS